MATTSATYIALLQKFREFEWIMENTPNRLTLEEKKTIDDIMFPMALEFAVAFKNANEFPTIQNGFRALLKLFDNSILYTKMNEYGHVWLKNNKQS